MNPDEITEIWEVLPTERRQLLADFARFLLEKENDDRWESMIADPNPRPRLNAFLRESSREGFSGRRTS